MMCNAARAQSFASITAVPPDRAAPRAVLARPRSSLLGEPLIRGLTEAERRDLYAITVTRLKNLNIVAVRRVEQAASLKKA